MRRGFGEVLWSSFKKVHGATVGAAGLVGTLLVYVFAFPESTGLRIAVVVSALVATIMIVAILTFADAAYELYRMGPGTLPRVLAGMPPFAGLSASAVCMLESSELFSHGIVTSFYRVEEQGFERLIGLGSVVNIQTDGKILVAMHQAFEGSEEFVNRLRANDSGALSVTLVKPNIPREFGLEGYGGSE